MFRASSLPIIRMFTLPRFGTDFLLNIQTDALIIQIYSVIKFYMFRASSVPIIRISMLPCVVINLFLISNQTYQLFKFILL